MPSASIVPSLLLLAAAISAPAAYAHPHAEHGHSHLSAKALPGSWYQPREHHAYNLFRRGEQTDGITYAAVGTPGPFNHLFFDPP